MPRSTSNRNIPALDGEALRRLALRYVERYATSRAKLTRYLERKLWECGWAGEGTPPVAELVGSFADLGYVNDRQFAEMRTGSLVRRGYGRRRIDADLRFAGIEADDIAATIPSEEEARDAALAFARRKRIGPFADGPPDMAARQRAFAAMARAGHPLDIIQEILTVKE